MRKTILYLTAILVLAAAARAERPVDETLKVDADARITIENVAGSIKISGWERAEVRVTGTLGDDVERLEIHRSGGDPSFEVVIPEGRRAGRQQIGAHLEISAPHGASLEVDSVSASIEISGMSGEIEAGSVSGSVVVDGDSPVVEVETVSGNIKVAGVSESVEAESVSGSIRLDRVTGDVEAVTVSGPVEVDAGVVADAELESVSGTLRFRGRLTGKLEAESHSGNVELFLPADILANFEAESFSGRIENEFGPAARRVDRYEPGLSLEFATGAGGDASADVSVETFSGNILLKKL